MLRGIRRSEVCELSAEDPNLRIFVAHRAELVSYAAAILGDRARAEDLVQDAYIRIMQSGERELTEPLRYWRRTIRNLAIDVLRGRMVEGRHMSALETFATAAEDVPSQEDALAHKAELRIVLDALAELPERSRRALEMHRFEGLKLKDIAQRLGISIGLAHTLVHDALDHCRRRLERRS